MRHGGLPILLLALAGCAAPGPAPVSEIGHTRHAPAKAEPLRAATLAPSTNGLHTVQRGDTLYAIAFANNLDYREVANWNHLESVDRILVGQVLRLTPPPGAVEIKPLDETPRPAPQPLAEGAPVLRTPQAVLMKYTDANWAQVTRPPGAVASSPPPPAPAVVASAVPASPSPAAPTLPATVETWRWPAEGTLAGRFGAAGGKGIDIVGVRNAPVRAVAPGKVVYSGSGLRGYGHLVIVKHPGEFLSAYAHNEVILVKEGDTVAAGQKIAQMGDSDAERVELHFEIRRYGKPLDPLTYLPERS